MDSIQKYCEIKKINIFLWHVTSLCCILFNNDLKCVIINSANASSKVNLLMEKLFNLFDY